MPPHRTLRVVAIVDRQQQVAWEQVLNDVRDFYGPVVDLTFSIQQGSFRPIFNSSYPGLAPTAIIDYDWYDRFITIPNLGSADLVLFLTPRPATPITYLGFMSSANCGPYECTVFCGQPSDHIYINGIDQGSSNTTMIAHEISHALYAMMGIPDRTHEHFLSGDPGGVLNDLSFPPMTIAQQWADIVRRLNGALFALGLISKYRSTSGDEQPVSSPPPAPTPVDPPGMKLYNLAKASLGADIAKQENELGCAEAVSGLLNHAYGDVPAEVLSTTVLNAILRTHPKFREVAGMSPGERGDVIMCATGEGRDMSDHGHVGVIATYGIMSNDSRTGLFKENYTISSWQSVFVPRGFPIHVYRRVQL